MRGGEIVRKKKKIAPDIKKDVKERQAAGRNLPRLVIVSNGNFTSAWLNGVHIGQGIRRLEFLAEHDGKEAKSTIRVMDLDVQKAKFSTDKEQFMRFMDILQSPID